ncbi:hypothetical protein J2S00_000530 [Caldalkalibacillus uzonensis]|uniref:Uncharacterized protein n=1 Tax=Caldalkalibacillus uzonensis TaxID=353224 RepID=A0ABU0CMX5_9BACI|nr:hypothetical protein [Caldalkalibacillus uzonensis]MDQ0337760.1 hypothetical protein [Caldalkalibacillus uzonensis]
MNDGYFYMIVIWILLILAATRWLDFLWAAHPWKSVIHKGVIILLVAQLVTQGWYVSLPSASQYAMNVNILMTALICGYRLWRDKSGFMMQMVAVILFLGVLYAVSHQLFLWDPVLMVLPPFYLFPVFFSLLLLLTTLHLPHLWLMMASGMILGELLHKLFLLQYVDYAQVGDAAFRDQLAMGLCLVTGVAFSVRYGIKGYRYLHKLILSQWKEEG